MNDSAPDFLQALAAHAASNGSTPAFRLAGDDSDVVLDYAGLADRVARLGSGMAGRVSGRA